jgi:predicted transcriptional regulator
VEVSAKELFVKDMEAYERDQDFMLGSTVAPSANPNSYPMTDETTYPSDISVFIGGEEVYSGTLPDDPADHRGVLSWHHQLKDRKLREAGSYGYLLRIPVKKGVLREAIEQGKLDVRIATRGEEGVAIYGKAFGRYPLDPSLVLIRK